MSLVRLTENAEPSTPPLGKVYIWFDTTDNIFKYKDESGIPLPLIGNGILNGTVDPTTEGNNGDFYLNTTSNEIFGPKAAGTWPAGISLVGPTGVDGATGATGAPGTNGQGVPVGGTANQVLSKIDATDYNTQWVTGGGGSVTNANNVGAGNAVFKALNGTVLDFKTLVPGTAISMTGATDTVTVNFNGDKTSVGLGNVDNTADTAKPVSTLQQAEIDTKQDILTAAFNQHFYNGPSGGLIADPNMFKEPTYGGNQQTLTPAPNNLGGSQLNSHQVNIEPLQDSANENYNVNQFSVSLDNASSGFGFGTSGSAVSMLSSDISHQGTGDVGAIEFVKNNFNIGNGTDAIDVGGFRYNYGFGTIQANVNISGSMQGYGYQPNVVAGASVDTTNAFTQAFFDGATISCPSGFYTSFGASPTLAEIVTDKNYTAFNVNPTITKMTGNGSVTLLGLYGNYADIDTGSFNCIQINPTLTYTGAGSFGGIQLSPTITNAPDNATGVSINMNNVSGTFSPGQTPIALNTNGRTQVGAEVTAFDGGGNPAITHGFNTNILATVDTANADTGGSGYITQITTSDNVDLTSGGFQVGQAAVFSIMLPNLGVNSTVDYTSGHISVMNITTGAGTISEHRAYRSAVLKTGGTTAITRSKGFFHHSPFGTAATTAWGCYIEDDQNYFESGLKIGGTAGTADTTTHKLEVEGSSLFNGNLGFYNKTPVAQPASSGATTATASYTATEQGMLQEVYDAVRSLGLMA